MDEGQGDPESQNLEFPGSDIPEKGWKPVRSGGKKSHLAFSFSYAASLDSEKGRSYCLQGSWLGEEVSMG